MRDCYLFIRGSCRNLSANARYFPGPIPMLFIGQFSQRFPLRLDLRLTVDISKGIALSMSKVLIAEGNWTSIIAYSFPLKRPFRKDRTPSKKQFKKDRNPLKKLLKRI